MTLLDRLAEPPSRVVGIALAALAAVLMLAGPMVLPDLLTSSTQESGDTEGLYQLVSLEPSIPALLVGNIVGLLGFLPLLGAVHAVLASTAKPAGALLAAYLVLLIRPVALLIELAAQPGSVLVPLGPVTPYLLLATTGIAAGLASVAILPLARDAASPVRRWTLAAVIAVLVALALFAFAPYIAPVSALGLAAALVLRRGDAPNGVSRAGMNGPAGQS